jgi:hypothetical protein
MNKARSKTAADAALVEALKARQASKSLSGFMPLEVQESLVYVRRMPAEQQALVDQWAFEQLAELPPQQQVAVRYLLDRAFSFVVQEEVDHRLLLQAMDIYTKSRCTNAGEKLQPARKEVKRQQLARLRHVQDIMRSHDHHPGSWVRLVMHHLSVSKATAHRLVTQAKKESSHLALP